MGITRIITALGVAALVAGCSGGGFSSLTTGSIFGGGSKAKKPRATVALSETAGVPAAPVDPLTRSVQIGWTVARAEKCEFQFRPAKLKSDYLAFEANQGATPEQLQKIERAYDYSRLSVAKRIAPQKGYCTEPILKVVRADLPRLVAGDFNIPTRHPEADRKAAEEVAAGSFFLKSYKSGAPETLDRHSIFKPRDEM